MASLLATWSLYSDVFAGDAAGFIDLGELAGGESWSNATAISRDGSVVVGRSGGPNGMEAFRWTLDEGMVGLGDLPGGSFLSEAFAVSADGAVITGRSQTGATQSRAFRWTSTSGMVALLCPNSQFSDYCIGQSVSTDGSRIVGVSGGFGVIAWGLGGALPYQTFSLPLSNPGEVDISGNGQYIVGPSSSGVWRSALPSGPTQVLSSSQARAGAISADGTIVYGHSLTHGTFRWTAATGVVRLNIGLYPEDCSDDGLYVTFDYDQYIWDDANGLRAIEPLLSDLGIPHHIELLGTSGISGDGRRVCGIGVNDAGEPASWRATIPLPGDTYGDINGDGAVDVDDLVPFRNCMKGPAVAVSGVCRAAADLSGNARVDLQDCAILQSLVLP